MTTSLTAFAGPAKRELAIGFAAIAVFLAVGRFIVFEGSTWNMLAILATAVLFGIAARRVDAARSLDVPSPTWFGGFALVALAWSSALSVIAVASTLLSWSRSPWYTRYDAFVVTEGSAPFPDTNGEPYSVPDAGTTTVTWGVTLLVFLSCFLMVAALGAAIGAVASAWNGIAAIGVVVAGLAAAVASAYVMALADIRIQAPYPGVFIFCIPLAVAGAAATWFAARHLEP